MALKSQSSVLEVPTEKIKIAKDGSIAIGAKKFICESNTIRRQIIELIAGNAQGHLIKSDYERELITGYLVQNAQRGCGVISEPYLRRQNNVEKALSRLRHDLAQFFKDDLPPGTAWLCFSRKIKGWLLYRLPGLGCDGDYHW